MKSFKRPFVTKIAVFASISLGMLPDSSCILPFRGGRYTYNFFIRFFREILFCSFGRIYSIKQREEKYSNCRFAHTSVISAIKGLTKKPAYDRMKIDL